MQDLASWESVCENHVWMESQLSARRSDRSKARSRTFFVSVIWNEQKKTTIISNERKIQSVAGAAGSEYINGTDKTFSVGL